MSASCISRVRLEVTITIGGCRRLHRAELGDRHLEIGEHFQQERLERLVGAVELVDEQHRRAGRIGRQRFQQRPPHQEALGENIGGQPLAVDAFGFGDADRDHLRRVVPLVERRGDVEPLVALQPHQPPPERRRKHFGDLGLADARLAFEEQRAAHLEREIQHGRKRPVGHIIGRREQVERGFDRGWQLCGHRLGHERQVIPSSPDLSRRVEAPRSQGSSRGSDAATW